MHCDLLESVRKIEEHLLALSKASCDGNMGLYVHRNQKGLLGTGKLGGRVPAVVRYRELLRQHPRGVGTAGAELRVPL